MTMVTAYPHITQIRKRFPSVNPAREASCIAEARVPDTGSVRLHCPGASQNPANLADRARTVHQRRGRHRRGAIVIETPTNAVRGGYHVDAAALVACAVEAPLG